MDQESDTPGSAEKHYFEKQPMGIAKGVAKRAVFVRGEIFLSDEHPASRANKAVFPAHWIRFSTILRRGAGL
jgi:hypothetical protein